MIIQNELDLDAIYDDIIERIEPDIEERVKYFVTLFSNKENYEKLNAYVNEIISSTSMHLLTTEIQDKIICKFRLIQLELDTFIKNNEISVLQKRVDYLAALVEGTPS